MTVDYNTKTELLLDAEKYLSDNHDRWQQLVKKLWKEVFAFYSDLSASKRRTYSRLWGVIFVYETPAGKNFVMYDIDVNSTINVPFAELSDETVIEIVNRGKTPLWICRTDADNVSCNNLGVKILTDEAVTRLTAAQLGSSTNGHINITNPDLTTEGEFEIYIHNLQ